MSDVNTEVAEMAIDASAKVAVSKDKLQAYVLIASPSQDGKALSKSMIEAALKQKNIQFGIDENMINELEKSPIYEKGILIATGIDPKSGTDGRINYLFDLENEKKPQILENGKVDYHNLGFVKNVKKGQVLAEIVEPIEGVTGKDVYGKDILVRASKRAIIPKGKNVIYDDQTKKLVAAIDGQVGIQDGKIVVLPQIEINGNIDASTGDICFVGNVLVKGNLVSDFKIEAGGDVEVLGAVEASSIKAKGNIMLRKGVQGMGKAVIESEGDVISKYIENATVTARGDIKCDAIMHSNITCNGSLISEGKNGLIVGGVVRVGYEIKAKAIGSPMATLTEIQVGVLPEEIEKLRNMRDEISKLSSDFVKAEQVIVLLNKLKGTDKFTKDKEEMLIKSVRSKVVINSTLTHLRQEAMEFDEKVSMEVSGRIKTLKVYPGVTIAMGNSKKYIKETFENCMFYEEGAEIKISYL
jgi:uncharacterized protein (DUF342 family)